VAEGNVGSVKVLLASPLRRLAGGAKAVEVEAQTVEEALARLCEAHPELRGRLFSGDGLKQDARIFLNRRDIRGLGGLDTAVAAGDEISIVPLVAGA
jgi:molybdopterin synthase sulfur carrier subunit